MSTEEFAISHHHLQAAHHWMNRVCGPHELFQRSRAPVAFRHEAVRFPGFGTVIGRIGYGTAVTIGVQRDAPFKVFSLSLPQAGEQILQLRGERHVSTPQRGVIISPSAEQALEMTAQCEKLQVVIPQAAVARVAEELLGPARGREVALAPGMDLRDPAVSAWWQMINQTFTGWGRTSPLWHLPGLAADFERTLIKGLLLAQPGSCADRLTDTLGGRLPASMQRVEQFLALHLRETIDLAQLEAVAGVSRQKLYDTFHALYGCTPLGYVKRRRLEGVRRGLEAGLRPGETVSTLALHWGFNHLSRFSRDYAEAFGELPSHTAARARHQPS